MEVYRHLTDLTLTPGMFLVLVRLFNQLGQTDLEKSAYHKAIALNPGMDPEYNRLGLLLEGIDKLDEALNVYKETVANSAADAQTQGRLESLGKCVS